MKTNKIILGLVAGFSAMGIATIALAGGTLTATAPVTATISSLYSLTKTTNMAFGTIIKPQNANTNTVTLATTGGVTLSGTGDGAFVSASTHSQAIFSLVAPSGTTYASVTSLVMSPTLANTSATTTPTTTTGIYGTVPTGGTQDLNVGGQFDINNATVAQAYTGTLTLTVNYN